jgi:hypothetical protein
MLVKLLRLDFAQLIVGQICSIPRKIMRLIGNNLLLGGFINIKLESFVGIIVIL